MRAGVCLFAVLAGSLALRVDLHAQQLTSVHSFAAGEEGGNPYGGLTLFSNVLYGTASLANSSGFGNVFALNIDGTGFRVLHHFNYAEGANPSPTLISIGNALYGSTGSGGSSGWGTIFAINTDGSAFRLLHNFTALTGAVQGSNCCTNNDGAAPIGLIASGGILYGTTAMGGSFSNGTVFAVNTNGNDFTTLHNFSGGADGANPIGLISSGQTLYGTTSFGGGTTGDSGSNEGTIFAVGTDGSGFVTLHTFKGSDGANPMSGLILSGSTLFGTARYGGATGNGTVFALNVSGTGFTNLYDFTGSEGANPVCSLILSGGTLYGTAAPGGRWGSGTLFAIKTDGTGFATLHNFAAGSTSSFLTNEDGVYPAGNLVLSQNVLYGTAVSGGSKGWGTVFRMVLQLAAPHLAIIRTGPNVVLKWPTNDTGFKLQSSTDLSSLTNWGAVPAISFIEGEWNVLTNPLLDARRFFRLSQ